MAPILGDCDPTAARRVERNVLGQPVAAGHSGGATGRSAGKATAFSSILVY